MRVVTQAFLYVSVCSFVSVFKQLCEINKCEFSCVCSERHLFIASMVP